MNKFLAIGYATLIGALFISVFLLKHPSILDSQGLAQHWALAVLGLGLPAAAFIFVGTRRSNRSLIRTLLGYSSGLLSLFMGLGALSYIAFWLSGAVHS